MSIAPTSITARLRIAAVVAAALLAGPLLAGCSADAVGGAVNGAVQGATGGEVSLGGKLPAGWPVEVPVVSGKLLLGAANTTDGSNFNPYWYANNNPYKFTDPDGRFGEGAAERWGDTIAANPEAGR